MCVCGGGISTLLKLCIICSVSVGGDRVRARNYISKRSVPSDRYLSLLQHINYYHLDPTGCRDG